MSRIGGRNRARQRPRNRHKVLVNLLIDEGNSISVILYVDEWRLVVPDPRSSRAQAASAC
jgi:hypothetical protein